MASDDNASSEANLTSAAGDIVFAHTASPTGAIVVDTPVERIQILTDQSEEPIEMLISPSGKPIDIYLWHLRLDQLPHLAT